MKKMAREYKPRNNAYTDDLIVCKIDSIPVNIHLRCRLCTILIGQGHHEPRGHTIDGTLICSDCLARLRKKSRKLPIVV